MDHRPRFSSGTERRKEPCHTCVFIWLIGKQIYILPWGYEWVSMDIIFSLHCCYLYRIHSLQRPFPPMKCPNVLKSVYLWDIFPNILINESPSGYLYFGEDGRVDCCCSVAQSCLTLCDPMDCSMPGLPVLHQLLELAQTHIHWVSDAIQPSHPLLSPSPPAFNLSHPIPIRVFSKESVLCIRWPKYWSFSFSISPSNEYSGLISFRIDWFDLLAVQGTLKNLIQHHSSKASVLQLSAFFIVQLSHPYMTTGKTITLTRRTFVSKVMSLLFDH